MRRLSATFFGCITLVAFGVFLSCEDEQDQPGPTPTSSATHSTGVSMGGAGPSTASATTSVGGQGSGGSPAGYPPGPYGNNMGDTFPYLVWHGYVATNPAVLVNTEPWTDPYTADDVRTSGAPFALIHTALFG